MTSLYFQGTKNAYLPEIEAYRNYLALHYPHIMTIDSRIAGSAEKKAKADIVWHFMGMDRANKKPGQYVVHEYNSLSTGRMARFKNKIKMALNATPDARVFLSPDVRHDFPFRDNLPFHLRDMGIDERFFAPRRDAEFDFIYVGSLDRGAIIASFLDFFAEKMKDSTLLLIGQASAGLKARYKKYPHIVFQGRVPYAEVPGYMARARYGLNLMPDRYPFNVQTSTKLLEYCAAGLGIVSTKYRWAEEFSRMRDANFFWLKLEFGELQKSAFETFDFKTPDVRDLAWNTVIGASGVFDFLKKA